MQLFSTVKKKFLYVVDIWVRISLKRKRMPVYPRNPNAKTLSIPEDVQIATQVFVARGRGKGGNQPRTFSEAVVCGLKLLFNRNETSVEELAGMAPPALKESPRRARRAKALEVVALLLVSTIGPVLGGVVEAFLVIRYLPYL